MDPSTSLIDDMTKLASSDIVLTTYDVLKEDLSHDSDRHDGDRRCMRFQKRYYSYDTIFLFVTLHMAEFMDSLHIRESFL